MRISAGIPRGSDSLTKLLRLGTVIGVLASSFSMLVIVSPSKPNIAKAIDSADTVSLVFNANDSSNFLYKEVEVSPSNEMYVSNTFLKSIQKWNGTSFTTVVGTGVSGTGTSGQSATSFALNDPAQMTFDSSGNLFIADGGNNRIVRANIGSSGDGNVDVIATGLNYPVGVAIASDGTVYASDGKWPDTTPASARKIWKIPVSGSGYGTPQQMYSGVVASLGTADWFGKIQLSDNEEVLYVLSSNTSYGTGPKKLIAIDTSSPFSSSTALDGADINTAMSMGWSAGNNKIGHDIEINPDGKLYLSFDCLIVRIDDMVSKAMTGFGNGSCVGGLGGFASSPALGLKGGTSIALPDFRGIAFERGGRLYGTSNQPGGIIAVTPPPIVLPTSQTISGASGVSVNADVDAWNLQGTVTYSVTNGSLPPGVTLNSSTGAIAGVPTDGSSANVTITATGSIAGSANATIIFSITAPPTTTTVAPTTTVASSTPAASASGPTLVTSANQATLTAAPGKASVLVNGVAVTPQIVTASNSAAAQADPAERTPEQVRELQQAASVIETRLDTIAGGDSGVSVVRTETGAVMTGIFSGTRVPVEDVVVVNAADTATLFAARDVRGNIVEVKPGAVLEVASNGDVAVQAFGLRPGENVELVVMSTPTLLGNYTVDAKGTIKTTAKLPTTIGTGNHSLVVASPSVKASLGLKLVKSSASLPTTGAADDLMNWAVAVLLSGVYLSMVSRSRRRVL